MKIHSRGTQINWLIPGLAILAGAFVANAVITATLATVDERYQARIVWIIPLFAIILIISILNTKFSSK